MPFPTAGVTAGRSGMRARPRTPRPRETEFRPQGRSQTEFGNEGETRGKLCFGGRGRLPSPRRETVLQGGYRVARAGFGGENGAVLAGNGADSRLPPGDFGDALGDGGRALGDGSRALASGGAPSPSTGVAAPSKVPAAPSGGAALPSGDAAWPGREAAPPGRDAAWPGAEAQSGSGAKKTLAIRRGKALMAGNHRPDFRDRSPPPPRPFYDDPAVTYDGGSFSTAGRPNPNPRRTSQWPLSP